MITGVCAFWRFAQPFLQHYIFNVFGSCSYTISWIPPSDMSNIQGYIFSVTGEGCGCLSMNVSGDTTSVTCSGWTAAGQICSFEVRTLSQDCGFTSDPVTRIIVLSGIQMKTFRHRIFILSFYT